MYLRTDYLPIIVVGELEGSIKTTYHQALEVKVRMCDKCYRCYSGVDPICPYCQNNNGKTQTQIKADEQAELERIESMKNNKIV